MSTPVSQHTCTIIGAGLGGIALIANMGLAGYRLRLHDLNESRITKIRERGGLDVEGLVEGFAPVELVTSDLAPAIDGADLIIAVTGSNFHADVARGLAPLLRDGQTIVLIQGGTGGSLIVRHELRRAGCRARVDVAEMDNYPYSLSWPEPTRVKMTIVKRFLQVAALPAARVDAVLAKLRTAFPRAVAAPSILATGLNNMNATLHVVNMVGNVGRLEANGNRHRFYAEGYTASLVTLLEEKSAGSLAERMPASGEYVLQSRVPAVPTAPAAKPKPSDMIGDVVARSGLQGLEIAEDVTMVCCPDLMALHQQGVFDDDAVKAVQLTMIAHCETMGDRVAILDAPLQLTPQSVLKWRMKDTNYDSKYAALYYPWIKVPGSDGAPLAIPPSGHMAGIYARNDNERGVHKAPANEVVRGALEATATITKGEQDTLNPEGVNCIRSFSGRGLRVWGARTLSSDPAWRYINVRRLFNYVEKSLERGTQWIVFEPNDPDLWARIKRDAEAFLTGVWREGALFGRQPAEAFFVKCDDELNPPDVRDRGQLFIDIGLAPVKPAEFVIFRFSQWAGGGA